MATSKLMLNKARRLNNGTYPLVMQIIHRRQKQVVYSKIYLYENEFDQQSGTVKFCRTRYRTNKEIKSLNRTIDKFRQCIEHIICQCDKRGLPYTAKDITQNYLIASRGQSLYDYWHAKINQLNQLGRLGTSTAQYNTMRSVIRFNGPADIGFTSVNSSFIKFYRSYLLLNGLSLNTIAYYMRNLKSIINSAIRDGVMAVPEINIFNGIDTSPKKTLKRALTRDELRALLELNLENEPELEQARDMFLFSFYTRGMAFVDVVFLKKENLSKETILYTRKKTGQLLRIGVNAQIRHLIEKYTSSSQYIFPAIHSVELQTAYTEYRKALRLMNLWLKTVGKRAGIQTSLTTYVARHSWATQAKERGASVSVISEGLGHTSEKITRIYLKDFDHSVLDSLNDQVVNL